MRRRRLRLESLEARHALAAAIVNTLGNAPDADANDGVCDVDLVTPGEQCTLAAAASFLNANSGGTLTLGISGTFDPVEFTQAVAFDGGSKSMELTGSGVLKFSTGGSLKDLTLAGSLDFHGSDGTVQNIALAGSAGMTITGDRNLIKQNTVHSAVLVAGDHRGAITIRGSNNRIEGNLVGITATAAPGNGDSGILIDGTTSLATQNLIIGNGIGASATAGVEIRGAQATFNKVEGNLIGTNTTGTAARPNGIGVWIVQAVDTSIGGPTTASNTISGNTRGIVIEGLAPRTIVDNNLIGLTANSVALGNAQAGIHITNASGARDDITIRNNTISSNGGDGVTIESSGVKLLLNRIGTDVTGALARGNGGYGVRINATGATGDNGSFNAIGATDQGNLISANALDGVGILGGQQNVLVRNFIGTTGNANAALPNLQNGVGIYGGTQNSVGIANLGNLISGNGGSGVLIVNGTQNLVATNTIGLNGNSTQKIPNALDGVEIRQGTGNRVGDSTVANTGNTISGNLRHGVFISQGAAQSVVVRNIIGTNPQNAISLGNAGDGVLVDGSHGSRIGQSSIANLIVGNAGRGIALVSASQTQVKNNLVGLGTNGTALANVQGGISLSGSTNNTIGGLVGGERNYVSGNGQFGIGFLNGSNSNAVHLNYVGINLDGQSFVSGAQQPIGILIDGSESNLIGTDGTSGAGNLVAGNSGPGIVVRGTGAKQNKIGGNLVGLNSAFAARANAGHGIVLTDGANGNLVGGTATGAVNLIAGNTQSGIALLNQANNNTLQLNSIGFQSLGNGGPGVLIDNAQNNLIGDPTGAAGNSIRNHAQGGVSVGASSTGNRIVGNGIVSNTGGGILLAPALANLPRTAVIREITRNNNNVTLYVQVKAEVGTTVRMDYYANQVAHPSGFGEGQRPLGSATVQIPASGVALVQVSFDVPDTSFVVFTATLTDANNTTYGFSHSTTISDLATEFTALTTSGPTNDIQPIQLSATLRQIFNFSPQGIVEFYDGDTKLGEATINASRTATLSVQLPQGVHQIYAIYKGSNTFCGVISAPLSVNVVAGPPNQIPIANTDTPSVQEDGTVNINVLANDVDPDGGTILATSVTITQQPTHGTATVNPTTGVISYKPQTNYDGPDQLRYTITDNRGGVSAPGVVNITVTDIPEPYHNKLRPLDVDNDGKITATDAVLVINQLNALGPSTLPPPPGAVTYFYDTDGDNFLAAVDALLVINAINAGGGSEAAGEPPPVVAPKQESAEDFLAWLWQEEERKRK